MSEYSGAGEQAVIGLVATGGTIGAAHDGRALSVGARPTSSEAGLVAAAWPGEGEPRVAVAQPLRKLSENLVPSDWPRIAADVRRLVEVDGAAGVLVLHGTDTMAYTAAALSYLLADLAQPVVLTGSKLPAEQAGSDAPANVRAALVALRELRGGVYVVSGAGERAPSRVYLGTRVRKQRDGEATFASIGREPVATIADDRLTLVQAHAHRPRPSSAQAIDERVLALRLYPGLDFAAAAAAVASADARAVIVELYGSATGPATEDRFSLPAFIGACAERGTLVATCSPGAPGAVAGPPQAYETTLAIAQAGGVSLRDMTFEAAVVKAMWALAQRTQAAQPAELMLEPIAGELAGARAAL
ncbi:MAG: asparaginase domain-containing protein [Solirubrobacteraceae bacterium]